ncbi:MAG: DUF2897 family protein [Gammaproteobacteria bacterium]
MMRMVLEIVMVLAVVIGMLMLLKATANENKTLPDRENTDDDKNNQK